MGTCENRYVKQRAKSIRINTKPDTDPFTYALTCPKYARIGFEEFEKESEEMQRELFEEDYGFTQ